MATQTFGTGTDALKVTLHRGRQSLEGSCLAIAADGTKIRGRVVRDSYDFQSYAVAEAWTTERGFQNVLTRPIEDCRIFGFSYVTRDEQVWREAIGLDLLQLVTEAEAFLS